MAEKSLNGDWLVPMPKGQTPRKSWRSVQLVSQQCFVCKQSDAGIKPEDGEILVTGASGGVGSVSITLLKPTGL